MHINDIIELVLVNFVLFNISFYLFAIGFAAYRVYYNTLMRHGPEQFNRDTPELIGRQVEMDAIGQEWMKRNLEYKKDVHICREGINLYGEYYDFGYDRTVHILSGRTDTLRYGYYFAIPYANEGYNVLVSDPRAHGLSDGKYITVGFEESKDVLAWSRYLHDELGTREVLYHGICIGGASGLLAITREDCPDYVAGIVTEGVFANFNESMRNHIIERKKNFWPVMWFINLWMKRATGYTMREGPIDHIHKMKKPLLMIQSHQDPYSTAEFAVKMYGRCPSQHKTLVLFDEGGHSLLRITNTELYDGSIQAFVRRHFPADAVNPTPAEPTVYDEGPSPQQVVSELADSAFTYGLVSAIMSVFPVASIVAIFLGDKGQQKVEQTHDIAVANGLKGGGRYIAGRVLSLVGTYLGTATSLLWLVQLIRFIIDILSK